MDMRGESKPRLSMVAQETQVQKDGTFPHNKARQNLLTKFTLANARSLAHGCFTKVRRSFEKSAFASLGLIMTSCLELKPFTSVLTSALTFISNHSHIKNSKNSSNFPLNQNTESYSALTSMFFCQQ